MESESRNKEGNENICDACCIDTPDKYIQCMEYQQKMTGRTTYKACEFTFKAPCGATVQVEIEAGYTKPEKSLPSGKGCKYEKDTIARIKEKVEEFAKNRFKDKNYLQSLKDQKIKKKGYNLTPLRFVNEYIDPQVSHSKDEYKEQHEKNKNHRRNKRDQ